MIRGVLVPGPPITQRTGIACRKPPAGPAYPNRGTCMYFCCEACRSCGGVFPGLEEELLALGALRFQWLKDTAALAGDSWLPPL